MVDLKFLLDHKLTKEGEGQESPKDTTYSVVSDQQGGTQVRTNANCLECLPNSKVFLNNFRKVNFIANR